MVSPDKDYKNAALRALSALSAVGEFAGLTFLAKDPKVAKYVKLTTKVIGHGSTFALAASGGINSAVQVYHNTREGKFFTVQNLMDVTNVGLSVFTMICSGKQTFESGRELAGMLKQDVPAAFSKAKQALSSAWSSIKNQALRLRYDTGGFVNLDVLKEPISFRNSGKTFGKYKFNEKVDVDLRGKGTYKDALDMAFEKVGIPKEEFKVTWRKDKYGKSFSVEWEAEHGAQVNIDIGHSPDGDASTIPHVG